MRSSTVNAVKHDGILEPFCNHHKSVGFEKNIEATKIVKKTFQLLQTQTGSRSYIL